MKTASILKQISMLSLLTASCALAWDGNGGPSDSELILKENPSGILTDTLIQSGTYAGDIGILASGNANSAIYLADPSLAGEAVDIWFKTGALTGGSAAKIYGGTFSGAQATFGQLNLMIGGETTDTLQLSRLYGGAGVYDGASITYSGINMDVYGNVQSELICAGGNIGTSLANASPTSVVVQNDIVLNIHGGSVEAPTESVGDGVHATSSGIYGGAKIYTMVPNVEVSFEVGGSIQLNLNGDFTLNGNVFTAGEAMNQNTSILVKNGSMLTIDGVNLYASEAVVGGARATFALGTSGSTAGAVAEVQGGSQIIMNSGTVGGSSNSSSLHGFIGGGWASGGGTSIVDFSKATINGGTVNADVFGGSYAQQNGKSINGNSSDLSGTQTVAFAEINGGTVNGNVFGGSRHDNAMNGFDSSANIYGNTQVVINDGTINGGVIGGSLALNGQDYGNAVTNIYGNTYVEINGGTLQDVLGGSYAQSFTEKGTVEAVITGNTNITVSGGKITGNIFGGGYGQSVVQGGSNVAFVGNGADIQFRGTVYGTGTDGSVVQGEKTFSFGTAEKAFTGDFNGKISEFDTITVHTNSAVLWNNYNSDSNSLYAVTNNGRLGITLDKSLEAGATVALSVSNQDNLAVFGGTYDGANLVVGAKQEVATDDSGTANIGRVVTENENIVINNNVATPEPDVALAFNVNSESGVEVNSIVDISSTLPEIPEVTIYQAWDFDVTLGEGDAVHLSLLVGDETLELSQLLVWHKGDDGQWENVTDQLDGLSYDGQYISFIATDFSSWSVSTVIPEPAAASLLAGILVLAMAICRRRR